MKKDLEKLDRIMKSYISELQKLMGNNFKYAEAQSCVINGKWADNKITTVIVMHKKQHDMAFLTKKIAGVTAKYNKRTGVNIQPVLQWADDGTSLGTRSRKCVD